MPRVSDAYRNARRDQIERSLEPPRCHARLVDRLDVATLHRTRHKLAQPLDEPIHILTQRKRRRDVLVPLFGHGEHHSNGRRARNATSHCITSFANGCMQELVAATPDFDALSRVASSPVRCC